MAFKRRHVTSNDSALIFLFILQIVQLVSSEQGWAMGRESHGICVPGHESRDLGPGLGLILLGRLGLGQISLGQSRDKNL